MTEIFPEAEELRCWNHKVVNVLDRLPRRLQPEAKDLLRKIVYAEMQAEAERYRNRFAQRYGKAHPKARLSPSVKTRDEIEPNTTFDVLTLSPEVRDGVLLVPCACHCSPACSDSKSRRDYRV